MSQHGEELAGQPNIDPAADEVDYDEVKKSVPFLYNYFVNKTLEYPSLTVQWLPKIKKHVGLTYCTHYLLLGTNSRVTSNHLLINGIQIPASNSGRKASGLDITSINESKFDPSDASFYTKTKIVHHGEVNRARYMPYNPNIIATRPPLNDVFIFDTNKHPSTPQNISCKPNLRLRGHTNKGRNMSWNRYLDGHLLSVAPDRTICLWDINAPLSREGDMNVKTCYVCHPDVARDIEWQPKNPHVFIVSLSGRKLSVWDIRASPGCQTVVNDAHEGEVNCVTFNPFTGNHFATASTDKTAALWDIRTIKEKIHVFRSQEEEITKLEWSPTDETVLASCAGTYVHIWDVDDIGDDQPIEEIEYGPPELMFEHSTLAGNVNDFSWHPKEPYMMCLVTDDSHLQIWQMASEIYHERVSLNNNDGEGAVEEVIMVE